MKISMQGDPNLIITNTKQWKLSKNLEGECQKPETWSDYGYYEDGVMTHGMLSRWDNYVTMNDHDGWCMLDGYCKMGIIQNIGREVGEVINVFGGYGD